MTTPSKSKDTQLTEDALAYHALPRPGKLEVRPTKPLANPRDLSLAYSPGVAEACTAISQNPSAASLFTGRGNLVAVISNGSAALGLGNIGPLAAKPIMEGKAVLFKQFAHIDCFDIELAESDPEKFAEHVIALEPTFGAINLEDIKAPDCFVVERICRERMNIPVFHDDQHGTAIVVGAAIKNALLLTNREFANLKIVSTGGGAAGIACLNMLMKLGVKRENIWLCDIDGLVHTERTDEMGPEKAAFAQKTDKRTLDDVIDGADLFLGLSGPGVLKPDMVARMADDPVIFALANPKPEIMPEEVKAVAPGAIVATGRSDYPNQVNNVLCFPFIFRGALDVGATTINDEMQVACVEGIAALARKTSSAETAEVYGEEDLKFGPDYLIPKPFDSRLLTVVAGAVAKAAMDTGVAERPVADFDAYIEKLQASVYRSSMLMRPVFDQAASVSRRIAFAEGEDERVLRTAVEMLEETNDIPILIGRPHIIADRVKRYGLPQSIVDKFEIVNPEADARYREYWETYHARMARKGMSPTLAQAVLRTNTTVIAAVMVAREEADSMICGTFGNFPWHLNYVEQMLRTDDVAPTGALSLLILDSGPLFVADTHVHSEPTAQQIADTVIATARHIRRFGIEPKIAVCSNSQFGTLNTESAQRMRAALEILDAGDHDFIYEGEMPVDAALDPEFRERLLPNSRMQGKANAFVFSNAETAGGVKNSLKSVTGGIEVGPILMGMGNRAHIVTPSITVRGLVNIAALAGTPVHTYA
ncbi:MAG: NADP-dependent malic enzyme [Pseudomonadota bacterium]